MSLRTLVTRLRRDTSGLAMLEFAFSLPIFLTMSLTGAELSDGTLRYLLLLAALLTPRPPGLMVLNEPETSLHTDLLPPLARLIGEASKTCQIVVVTHDATLAEALHETGALRHDFTKSLGETVVDVEERPAWAWPER